MIGEEFYIVHMYCSNCGEKIKVNIPRGRYVKEYLGKTNVTCTNCMLRIIDYTISNR